MSTLVNPGEGRMDSWQLGESADEFVNRLPPLTTSGEVYDWIWVHNPHDHARNNGTAKQEQRNVEEFETRGRQLLAERLEKNLLKQRINNLAVETNVIDGKWMLFPSLDNVTQVWRLIVDAVINNRLGCTAKVSPDQGTNKARLICVYTNDFRDQESIRRVLQELVSMGVTGSRPIFYKSDAYTILGIYRETAARFGLHASIYSSQKMLDKVRKK
ncbi:DUF1917-domain-containing protein [Massarina eburnea CBS 473.64]|uniref:DUF1917-domain-containing protein n=1 Tax=Massarina eburnea CBS 473.64 TaxID=1395130 RepID=A0A6A6S0W9_9PLEO|nr:DUF1917-domain-containing protein [Massarina eburnea CBS 473.64]